VFGALERNGGIEWYIVEEEGKSCVEYGCIETALGQLRKIGKVYRTGEHPARRRGGARRGTAIRGHMKDLLAAIDSRCGRH
jgi:hypothetical protein